MLNELLHLAKDYESVALVLTSIGDYHTYKVELLGFINNFNQVNNESKLNAECEKCLFYYDLAEESTS